MKVRFEMEIDELMEITEAYVSSDHQAFKSKDAVGKTFLFVDKVTRRSTAVFCKQAAVDGKRADCVFYELPAVAKVADNAVDEHSNDDLMLRIQECCDKVCKTVQHYAEENPSGNGISEKTLLSALDIVTKKQ